MTASEALSLAVEYNGVIGVVITVGIAAIGFFHYLSTRKAEERGRQYDRYHKLLDDLNVRADGSSPFIDRQIAVVFEMRSFPEYYAVSLRILERSLRRWEYLHMHSTAVASVPGTSINTLSEEAKLSIKFIKRRQSGLRYLKVPPEDRQRHFPPEEC